MVINQRDRLSEFVRCSFGLIETRLLIRFQVELASHRDDKRGKKKKKMPSACWNNENGNSQLASLDLLPVLT